MRRLRGEATLGTLRACPHVQPDGSFSVLRATLRLVGLWAIWGAHACGASPHTTELAGAYAHSVTMLSGQYGLYWHVQGNTLHLAMDVNTTGWVGFGIAQPVTSTMKLADIVTAHVSDDDGSVVAVDRFTEDENAMPQEDCQQDWQTEGWTEVRLTRPLDTGDKAQDRLLDIEDAWKRQVRVIGAYGLSDTLSYHGALQRVGFKVDLFRPADHQATKTNEQLLNEDTSLLQVEMKPSNALRVWADVGRRGFEREGLLLHQREPAWDGGDDDDTLCTQAFPCEQGVRLPAGTSTVYTESCWSTETLLSGHQGPAAPWHVVGIHADVMKAIEAHMHHLVVRGFLDDDDCGRRGGGGAVGGLVMAEVLWAGGPGADALMLPSEAGFPIVHANSTDGFGYRSIAVQVHYTNDAGVSGLVDDSAVRLYISHTPREHVAGVLQLGDPTVAQRGTALPRGLSMVSYNCPTQCSGRMVGGYNSSAHDYITVFGSVLHMHRTGVAMRTQQMRDGQVIDSTTSHGRKVDAYSFDNQDFNPVQMRIQPGDSFITSCYYDSSLAMLGANETVSFGLGSNDEMCIDFLYYYPATTGSGSTFNRYCGHSFLGVFCGGIEQDVHQLSDSELSAFREWPLSCAESRREVEDQASSTTSPTTTSPTTSVEDQASSTTSPTTTSPTTSGAASIRGVSAAHPLALTAGLLLLLRWFVAY